MSNHITSFENMCSVQRSLHNLTHIVDQDDDIATYKTSISCAIDELSALRTKNAKLESECERLRDALTDVLDNLYIPDANCRCHIAPPCMIALSIRLFVSL